MRMKTMSVTLILLGLIVLCGAQETDDRLREQWSNLNFRALPSVYQQALLEVRATAETRDITK